MYSPIRKDSEPKLELNPGTISYGLAVNFGVYALLRFPLPTYEMDAPRRNQNLLLVPFRSVDDDDNASP